MTILDKSLEPRLGKRLQTSFRWYGYYGVRPVGIYKAPALYLGNIRLLTGNRIETDDLRQMWNGMSEILGMDCLKHYCVQLDFNANKIRFLGPDHLETEGLGKPFRLTTFFGEVSTHADFLGTKNASLKLDSSDYYDFVLKSSLFQRELQKQKAIWTNQWRTAEGMRMRSACFPEGEFAGRIYTNLIVRECPIGMWLGHQSLMGLRFMARHLVTLNFPKQTMYLQRQSVGPPPDDTFVLMESLGFVNGGPPKDFDARFESYVKRQPGGVLWLEASDFLQSIKKKGQLPGWAKDGQGFMWFGTAELVELQKEIKVESYPALRTIALGRENDPSTYHYAVTRKSKVSPWKLQRAWQTDSSGRIIREFPVP
jgi:hypothetical protein